MMTENTPKMEKWSIFLADDDATDQEIFRDALSEANVSVTLDTFNNGIDLLDGLDTTIDLPDVIFLDLYMPQMDGTDCLIKIRKNPLFNDIPIILYSTELDLDRLEEMFALGANKYLKKTASFESLVSALERTLQSLHTSSLSDAALINIVV